MKRGINHERIELSALLLLIGCIACFMGVFAVFYLFVDKKGFADQSNRLIQPIFVSDLRVAHTTSDSNTKRDVTETNAPTKVVPISSAPEAHNQSGVNEAQPKRNESPSNALGSENAAQGSTTLHPDYRNQRIARQSHESRLAMQNQAISNSLAQQELQNLVTQLPETDAYECIRTNDRIHCTNNDPRGKYLEGILYRAWRNPLCNTVTIGKRIGIVYSKCVAE